MISDTAQLSSKSYSHMIYGLSIAVHAFASYFQ